MIGETLGHYRILRKLGEGGMGEVYLAEDTKLGRKIALKILPGELADDPARLRRFEREARAVAALNHPNIVTIHSVEESRDVRFITMEHVEGKTLSELIPKRGLALNRLFEVAMPLADAMSSAHRTGITHRDLKPANVMVSDEGRLKILDFGLAKLKEKEEAAETESQLLTETATTTEAGTILGTVSHMSPEQAEGKPIDPRSDVFSLGIMLYEMATGERPFQGDTKVSIITSILRDRPPSVTEVNHELPRHLGRIIKRCLAKDPQRRYQTALELRNELEELKEEIDSGELQQVAGIPAVTRRRSWQILLPVLGVAAILVLFLAYQVFRSGNRAGRATKPVQASFIQLTDQRGIEDQPSLSPDGKWFLYAGDASGNMDIYLQAVGGRNPISLTPDSPDDDITPAFSPDGERIVFRSTRDGGGLFVMGRTGESVSRLTDSGFHPAWSPDGKEIVFATIGFDDPADRLGYSELWAVNVASGETRRVAEADAVQPRWSPGGHRIAYWGLRTGSGQRDIWTVPATGGPAVAVTDDPHLDWNPVWSPDGDYLYFSSDRGGRTNLWRVPIDEEPGRTLGPPEPITAPASEAGPLSISADGRKIAYTAWSFASNIQKVALDPLTRTITGQPSWVTRGSRPLAVPALSPDGKWIAFMSYGKQEDIFVVGTDGTGFRQLTDDAHKDRAPVWSPDGGEIAFFSNRGGNYNIWSIRPDGGGLRQLTTESEGMMAPIWSPDGKRMVCTNNRGDTVLFDPNAPWEEQTPERLPRFHETDTVVLFTSWSPDGRRLAGYVDTSESRGLGGVVVHILKSGQYRKLNDDGTDPVWLHDNRSLLYLTSDWRIRLLDTRTNDSRELVLPPASRYFVAGTPADDRTLYLLRIDVETDIWLLELSEDD